ncbi:hypothetical protein NDU88_004576 [Pleurodeles waltl]|uniref:ribonuclease H n=1 Tax=Pleurodeles waltl TaxID=8319 RepID=A0AAV7TA05_PLEWA|nr:hypothetical protein NDU88_004576 [Pleurodeles waltl]
MPRRHFLTPCEKFTDKVKASIKEEVSKMLTLGVIEKSSSPSDSPVVLVPKAAASGAKPERRFCVDYRGLNSVTRTDAHPIPRAAELVDRLGTAKFLSTFDLTSGYWQIALTEGAKERSAFSTPDGHYQFRVMPFGLKNAPATFQRLVNRVLAGKDAYCSGYLDDIAVHSSSWEEHLLYLKEVLQALQQAGLTIKASKCQIGQGSVVYLRQLVGGGKVQPLQAKIETVKACQPPRTQTEVRAFLGLTGYYCRFVKGYATIVSPLIELTSKKQPRLLNWTEACQKAFDSLKKAMCTAPVLKAPDYSQEFIVQIDASEHSIGAVLAQLNEEGSDQPVAFISRRLLPQEKRWSAIEREAFALVWALKKLRPYLFGTYFHANADGPSAHSENPDVVSMFVICHWDRASQDPSAHKFVDYGGHSDPGGRREPPAWREPPEYRCAVKRPPQVFWVSHWAGGRLPKGRPPAQWETPLHEDAGSEWSRRSGGCATGAVAPVAYFSVCKADTEIQSGALLRGPLQCPCHWHGHCRGPQGPHDTPHRHPVPGGRNRQEQDGDEGVGIPCCHGGFPGQRKTGGTPPVFLF